MDSRESVKFAKVNKDESDSQTRSGTSFMGLSFRAAYAANGYGLMFRQIRRAPAMLFILLISGYRALISPILPKSCRFYPSCSAYGLEAFRRLSFIRALYLTAWRIMRCNPFCRGGYDPLPEK